MQNKTNFPQNSIPASIQSSVKTNPSDKSPMQNSNNVRDGKQPHQPTESQEN
jgi:hypothetical protein